MSTHIAHISWSRGGRDFLPGRYSGAHTWRFDGGAEVRGSPTPEVAPPPASDPAAVDPEEAFVAALSSCHMLFFLAIAARRGFVVDSYEDAAEGELAKNAQGRMSMTRVILRPRAIFSGERLPTPEEVDAVHHKAHEACYIANSVTTDVRIEPRSAED
jgi:organic hydroperoxide reductase OsmC/OhrA